MFAPLAGCLWGAAGDSRNSLRGGDTGWWILGAFNFEDDHMKELLRSLCALSLAGLLAVPAAAGTLGTIFYIDMENHNFTQPSSYTSTPQIVGNLAAPYLNSLITPGNANSVQTAWASNYYNAG